MEPINIEKYLEKISEEKPSGDNLEYDPDYQALEQATAQVPAQEYGDTVVPAKEPDWSKVRELSTSLLSRTRDLRIAATCLAPALIHTDGFAGCAQALSLVHGYIDQYWETVHPQLDPDDDFDPAVRMNAIAALNDQQITIQPLRKLPLIDVQGVGRFSLRDMDIAAGKITTVAGDEGELPTREIIEGALKMSHPELLQKNAAAIDASLETIEQIKTRLMALTDVENASQLKELAVELTHAQTVLKKELLRRETEDDVMNENDQVVERDDTAAQSHVVMAGQHQTGTVNSRADVIILLDNICSYYAHAEPSSPVPLLLQRARRLAPMNFMEVVKELNVDGVAQIEKIVGCEEKKK